MANVTSCGDQTYFGNATSTVGWTTNFPNITVDNSGTVTVSGTNINLGGSGVGTTTAAGCVLTVGNSGTVWTGFDNKDLSGFCELVLSALGHDTTYDDFCKMSNSERKALLRDIKIKRVLD